MHTLIYINIFITLISFTIFFLIKQKFNFYRFIFNKFFFKRVLLYFFKKKLKILNAFFYKSFFLPNKIIVWKPIFKKTSYIGYFFNNNNKWK
jgi:hypothetical protein